MAIINDPILDVRLAVGKAILQMLPGLPRRDAKEFIDKVCDHLPDWFRHALQSVDENKK